MRGHIFIWHAAGVLTTWIGLGALFPRLAMVAGGGMDRSRHREVGAARTPWVIGGLTAPPASGFVVDGGRRMHESPRVPDDGRNPPPPIAEFFEQFHVLVTPTFSSKYPPGTALLMVPGVSLGLPALMFVLLGGATGALHFAVGRRVTNAWVALMAWRIWISAPATLWWGAGYFSEIVSAAPWMLGWWALLEWRDHGGRDGWFCSPCGRRGWRSRARSPR